MKTISQIRSEAIEASKAFSAVLRHRGDIVDARNKLASAEARRQTHSPDHFNRLHQRIAASEADLAIAEAYCEQVNPDRLRDHDAAEDAKIEADRQAREAEMVIREVGLQANREANRLKAAERLAVRARCDREAAMVLPETV